MNATENLARPSGIERVLRALVVDDVHINRELLHRFIEQQGHIAEQADGGAAAIGRVAAGGIDVVFMDVSMPDVDGLEATRRIRLLPGAAARTPVWAVTAQVFHYEVAQCLDAGMDGHLNKPVNPRLLNEVLQAVAQGRGVP
jgi:CheY-like chemotaxis protein